MDAQKLTKSRIHMLLFGYLAERFLKTLRDDEEFETNGVSVSIVEREHHIIELWNVSNQFTDYEVIKQLLERVEIIIYGINLSNANAFKYIDVIQADNSMNAVEVFMFEREMDIPERDHAEFPHLRDKYNLLFTFFENVDRGSCYDLLDEYIAEYTRTMARRERNFAEKLFRM